MRIFAAGIATETNTFAPAPTGLQAFVARGVHRGSDSPDNEYRPIFEALRAWAREEGHQLIVGLGAFANPGGIVTRAAYETLREELLDALRAALPVDAVILPLHGAMVAEGTDSCESDLVTRIRQIVGPRIPIGVQLDPHCHFTETLRTQASLVVAYKEYPHTDIVESLREVWTLTLATAAGRISPVMLAQECRVVALWHTQREPVRGLVRLLKSHEGQGPLLSVSFGHGFEFGDVPEAGSKLWVVSDAQRDPGHGLARQLLNQLRQEVWKRRAESRTALSTPEAALRRLQTHAGGKPLVLADAADNPGGGASGDSTHLLRALLEARLDRIAFGGLYDPGAVQICREAGEGATLELRVGGKCGPSSGEPLDLRVSVRALASAHHQTGLGARFDCGAAAWVSTDEDVHLLLIEKRVQTFGLDLFTGLGLSLDGLRGIVVKSGQHFRAAFAPLADDVLYVDTPALLCGDFARIPYRRASRNYWPRVADPWAPSAEASRSAAESVA